MANAAALMLSFAPLMGDATPSAIGLGHEMLIQSENSCGSFCLGSSNANFDVTMNALFSTARIPQQRPKTDSSISVSPIDVTTFDLNWHPFYDFALGSGYRTSVRSSERSIAGKNVRRLTATALEIPISVAARPAEPFSLAGRVMVRKIELKQDYSGSTANKTEAFTVSPHRWSIDGLWQKTESTAYGISYTSPARKTMTAAQSSSAIQAPIWTDPQEFTFSMARFASMRPPAGVTFGPFENVFHLSVSSVTWESGTPVAYTALATGSAGKDAWNLTGTTGQTQEFVFNTLDPSLSASVGLESTWMRNSIGSISTFTHVRLNHLAAKKDSTGWQGGFGLGLSSRYLSLQASTLWRDEDAGYAVGLSSSF